MVVCTRAPSTLKFLTSRSCGLVDLILYGSHQAQNCIEGHYSGNNVRVSSICWGELKKYGAEGGTRTPTSCLTRPSNVRVCQFRHFGSNCQITIVTQTVGLRCPQNFCHLLLRL